MTNAEVKQIEEIRRLKRALSNTTSPKLKKDYTKAIRRLKNELKIYRQLYYGSFDKSNC